MKQVNGIGGMSSAHDAIDGFKIMGTVPGITYITSLLWAFQILLYHNPSGPWFKMKMPSYQHRKSHCGDKMVL